MNHWLLRTSMIIGLVAIGPLTGKASAVTLEVAVETITKKLADYLKTEKAKVLEIKDFDVPNSVRGVNGQRVRLALQEKLKALGVKIATPTDKVNGDINWELDGRLSVNNSADPTITNIIVSLRDSNGNPAADLKDAINGVITASVDSVDDNLRTIPTNTDLQQKFEAETGRTVEEPLKGKPDTAENARLIRNSGNTINRIASDELRDSIANPDFFVRGSGSNQIIIPERGCPFGIQIQAAFDRNRDGVPDSPGYQTVPAVDAKGIPFVDLKEGQLVRIRVENRESFDVGVELLLDGVNSLHFASNRNMAKVGKWVIPAKKIGTIEGWYVGNGVVQKFLIAAEPDGVAAELKVNGGIGTIQALIFQAFPEGSPVPIFAAGNGSKGAFAKGPEGKFNGRELPYRFAEGKPLATISAIHLNPTPTDAPE